MSALLFSLSWNKQFFSLAYYKSNNLNVLLISEIYHNFQQHEITFPATSDLAFTAEQMKSSQCKRITSPKTCEMCKFWTTTLGILVYALAEFLAKQV
jgi:hypothetical protein